MKLFEPFNSFESKQGITVESQGYQYQVLMVLIGLRSNFSKTDGPHLLQLMWSAHAQVV